MRYTLGFLVALAACDPDQGPDYIQFNGREDVGTLEVGPEYQGAADANVTLLSSTGTVSIGQVTISPGGGPVGTTHIFTVSVDEAYKGRVQKVEVTVDSGERGTETFEFTQDSAEKALWVLDLTSYGAADESRVDSAQFYLWEDPDVSTPSDEDTDSQIAGWFEP